MSSFIQDFASLSINSPLLGNMYALHTSQEPHAKVAKSILTSIEAHTNKKITEIVRSYLWRSTVSIHIGACFDPHVELFLPLEGDARRCGICFEDFRERISQLTDNPPQWYFAAVMQDQVGSTPVCDAISLNTWLLTKNDFCNPGNRQKIIKIHYFVAKSQNQRVLSLFKTITAQNEVAEIQQEIDHYSHDASTVYENERTSDRYETMQYPYLDKTESTNILPLLSILRTYFSRANIESIIGRYLWQPILEVAPLLKPHVQLFLPLQGEEAEKISNFAFQYFTATPPRWHCIAMLENSTTSVSVHDTHSLHTGTKNSTTRVISENRIKKIHYFLTKGNERYTFFSTHVDQQIWGIGDYFFDLLQANSLDQSKEIQKSRHLLLQNPKITDEDFLHFITLLLQDDQQDLVGLEKLYQFTMKKIDQQITGSNFIIIKKILQTTIECYRKSLPSLPANHQSYYLLNFSQFLTAAGLFHEAKGCIEEVKRLNPQELQDASIASLPDQIEQRIALQAEEELAVTQLLYNQIPIIDFIQRRYTLTGRDFRSSIHAFHQNNHPLQFENALEHAFIYTYRDGLKINSADKIHTIDLTNIQLLPDLFTFTIHFFKHAECVDLSKSIFTYNSSLYTTLSALKNIQHLRIDYIESIDTSVPWIESIETLQLAYGTISDECFSNFQALPRLRELDLSYCCGFTGKGFQESAPFLTLKTLHLHYSSISIDTLRFFPEKLPQLQFLNISGCKNIQEDDLMWLQNQHPNKTLKIIT